MQTTAILFQIHYFDRWAERAFRELRAGSAAAPRVRCADAPAPGRPGAGAGAALSAPHRADAGSARACPTRPRSAARVEPLARRAHRPDPDALLARPSRTTHRYWAIEYDVRYTGPWRRFFAAFEERRRATCLAPMLCRRRDFPEWLFWPFAGRRPARRLGRHAGGEQLHAGVPRLRPARCGDGRGLPRGLGRPPRVQLRHGRGGARLRHRRSRRRRRVHPRGARGRFYSGTVRDVYRAPGTLVFKPTFFRTGSRPDMLWHPVKPFWLGVELRRELLAARSAVAAVPPAAVPPGCCPRGGGNRVASPNDAPREPGAPWAERIARMLLAAPPRARLRLLAASEHRCATLPTCFRNGSGGDAPARSIDHLNRIARRDFLRSGACFLPDIWARENRPVLLRMRRLG